ncbi:MAG: YihY/virulence factor BrkB family protein [Nitrospirae bacterium]|nr:YihY/virulence factor BrkB family protein [Nitrospirota bacterium]MCL5238140.1 YihY/virulence factor BrkB family protein [Nitrospirota bacterium]
MKYPRAIFKGLIDFFRDGGFMLAGSLSYFFMMTLIPFCLFLVTIFGYFLGENETFLRFFSAKLVSLFPAITHKITEELRKLISYRGLGAFTLVLYGLLSYQLFSSLEAAVNALFKIRAKRPFAISLLRSLLIVTLIITFVITSFGATSGISMLKELREFFPDLKIGTITGFLIRFVVPFVLVFLTATTLYGLLPLRKVRIGHALSGALFTAILLEAAKHLFTLYVVKVARLGTIYGPLSAFVIFLLWIYYSSCIFLIGAGFVHNLEGIRKRK